MPRFICAPDSYKGCLRAPEVAAAMAEGIRAVHPNADIDLCPIADGGEGTVEALVTATDGSLVTETVHDALGRPALASWGWLGPSANRTAVIEVAAASGLTRLAPDELDPLRTTTFGTGELIAAAAAAGARRILLGLGGSATNDGGCGAAMALGVRFFSDGVELRQPITGADLPHLSRIDPSHSIVRDVELIVCRDVDNPMVGPSGAAAVYGPQKGAPPESVAQLDRGLGHLARLWDTQLGQDLADTAGSGAAGGMGGGMVAMLGARSQPGIDTVLRATDFHARLAGVGLCLTGEGRFDEQSFSGKACIGVAAAAHEAGVATVGIVGQLLVTDPAATSAISMELFKLAPDLPAQESIERAAELLTRRTADLIATRHIVPR